MMSEEGGSDPLLARLTLLPARDVGRTRCERLRGRCRARLVAGRPAVSAPAREREWSGASIAPVLLGLACAFYLVEIVRGAAVFYGPGGF